MDGGNNLSLCSNEFGSTHIKTFWQELQDKTDLYDVTLACENGQIKTHKAILASSSPLLKNILKLNQNSSSFIFLKGVKYETLQKLINFIFQGEIDVAEHDLPTFLKVAEDLKIRGLSKENQGEDYSNPEAPSQNCVQIIPPSPKIKRIVTEKNINNIKLNSTEANAQLFLNHNNFKGSEMNRNDSISQTESQKRKININNDYKSNSMITDKRVFNCKKCDKQFSNRSSLNYHNSTVHEKVYYSCDQCNYKAKARNSLKKHVESVHQKLSVTCEECKKQFSTKDNLRQHSLSTHQGVRYPCEFCDYKAKQRGALRTHMISHH